MKYTLLVTRRCNLSCAYCYIGKENAVMSTETATAAIDFAFRNTPKKEKIDFGFFGGEPLLEFHRIKEITHMIENHPDFDPERVIQTVVTNGTIFNDEVADFLIQHNIKYNVSCDGPPEVHDLFRCFTDGRGSGTTVAQNIGKALKVLPPIPVNAVYHPKTLDHLPQAVDYLAGLGLKHIYLNPDFSAPWTEEDAQKLPDIYARIGQQYIRFYQENNPQFISLIDSKIALILRGGYRPLERCRMGKGEYAFAPSGNVYPCERLVDSDKNTTLRMGNIRENFDPRHACPQKNSEPTNSECGTCSVKAYCMNWCGCSNYLATGDYNKVGAFLCASERNAINTALKVFKEIESKVGSVFFDHMAGKTHVNSINGNLTSKRNDKENDKTQKE